MHRSRPLRRPAVALAAIGAVAVSTGPSRLAAQASPTVSGTASIEARVFSPLTVTTNETMTFGTVYRSVAKSIAFTDNTAQGRRARFTVRGEGGAAINCTITVPATLTSGANSMTIDDWQARHGTTDADGSGTTISLPTAPPTSASTSPAPPPRCRTISCASAPG